MSKWNGKYKILLSVVFAVVLFTSMFFVCKQWVQMSRQLMGTPLINNEQTQPISLTDATKIAEDYLKGQAVSVQQIQENGVDQYKIEVQNESGTSTTLYINKQNGEIVKQGDGHTASGENQANTKPVEQGTADPQQTAPSEELPADSTADPNQPYLSVEQAKAIALKEINGTIVDFDAEYEDGGLYYDFKIMTGKKLYEVEIHADSGLVTKISLEDDDDFYDYGGYDYFDDDFDD